VIVVICCLFYVILVLLKKHLKITKLSEITDKQIAQVDSETKPADTKLIKEDKKER